MERLAIIGSGDLGHQIAHLALDGKHYLPVGFFDDFETKGQMKHNLPILGKISDISEEFKSKNFDVLLIAIGYNHFDERKGLFERLKNEIPFGKIIHSSNIIDDSVHIGQGSVVYAGGIFDMNVSIGENVLIYNGCNFSHDVAVKSHSIISPGVQIAGFCEIGESVNLGIGTVLSDNIRIASKTRTGAGAVVTKSILNSGVYVGIPAKKIQK